MSQIKSALLLVAVATTFALSGCGDENSKAVFSSVGGHPSNWSTGHKASVKADTESCFGCHGEELDGGISKVSCTACHLGSPGSIHPLQWGSYAYARHSSYVRENGTASCANTACHGADLKGVPGSGPSCTSCHLGGLSAKHPAPWTQYTSHANYVKAKSYDSSSCNTATCHGIEGKGVFLSGPSCFACHPADPTDVAPVPDKHPHNRTAVWSAHPRNINDHGNYANITLKGDISSCNTSICHGPGGPAPSCSGCHNAN